MVVFRQAISSSVIFWFVALPFQLTLHLYNFEPLLCLSFSHGIFPSIQSKAGCFPLTIMVSFWVSILATNKKFLISFCQKTCKFHIFMLQNSWASSHVEVWIWMRSLLEVSPIKQINLLSINCFWNFHNRQCSQFFSQNSYDWNPPMFLIDSLFLWNLLIQLSMFLLVFLFFKSLIKLSSKFWYNIQRFFWNKIPKVSTFLLQTNYKKYSWVYLKQTFVLKTYFLYYFSCCLDTVSDNSHFKEEFHLAEIWGCSMLWYRHHGGRSLTS